MTDLPIASIPPAHATATRPTANALLRVTPLRNGAPQPNASPFQDALALELEIGLDGPFLPGLGVPAAAAKAGSSLKPGEDTAQAAIAADAPLGLTLVGMPPLPPAFASTGSERAGLAPDPRKDPLAKTSATPKTKLELPIAAAAANFAVPGKFAPASAGEIAPASATQNSPLQLPFAAAAADVAVPGKFAPAAAGEIAPASATQNSALQLPFAAVAADVAVPGKLPPSAEGEVRREVAFDTSLLDQHKAAPSAAIHTAGAAPAQVTQAPVAALEARVGERGWDQNLGDKLVWMAGQKQQVAELHLNPPDLGPLKITLTLNHDQASAQFVSAHAAVREAIEMAMPRLREMLADSGITLGNASVSTDAFREQAQPQHEPRAYPAPPAAAAADPAAVTRGERLLRRSHGLVDTFA